MPSMHIRYEDVASEITGGEDTDGSFVQMQETVVIPVCVPMAEVSAWLAAYDAENAYSPSAGDSRTIARVVLDALAKFQGS